MKKMTTHLWALMAAVLASALTVFHCSDSSSTDPDGSVNTNQNTQRDARPLPDVYRPDPGECDVTDLTAQSQCGPNARCTVVSGGLTSGTGRVACTDEGSLPAGTNCDITLPTGPDECQSGSVCADPMSTGQSQCMYFCEGAFGYCPEGVCAFPLDLADGSPFLCLQSDNCNALASPSTCDASANQGCYWNVLFQDVTMCLQAGTLAEGAPCDLGPHCYPDTCAPNDCAPGLTCFGPPGNMSCQPLCDVTTGQPCTTECMVVGHPLYGVCTPATP